MGTLLIVHLTNRDNLKVAIKKEKKPTCYQDCMITVHAFVLIIVYISSGNEWNR